MNFFYSSNGKIHFKKNKYFKVIENNKKMYFPNKRIDRVIVDHERHFLIYARSIFNKSIRN